MRVAKSSCRFGPVVFLALMAACTPPEEVGSTQCDTLAAHPDDPRAISAGVENRAVDVSAAIAACESAREAHPGVPRLEYQTGRAYALAGDAERAFPLFRAASRRGYPAAQFEVGYTYTKRGAYPVDSPEHRDGAIMLLDAAEKGFAPAYARAAVSYMVGMYVRPNIEKAMMLAEKSVAYGDPEGHYILGTLLLKPALLNGGEGKEAIQRATRHLRIASDASVPNAGTLLAIALTYGQGGADSGREIIRLLETDAANGTWVAAIYLSKIYEHGLFGQEPSNEMAQKWKDATPEHVRDAWPTLDIGNP